MGHWSWRGCGRCSRSGKRRCGKRRGGNGKRSDASKSLRRRSTTRRARKGLIDAEVAVSTAQLALYRARLHAIANGGRQREEQIASLLAQRERDEAAREATAQEARDAAVREEQERVAIDALESERTSLAPKVAEYAANVSHLDGVYRSERQATAGERLARERLARQIAQKEEQRAKSHDEAQTIASRLATTERELTAKAAEVDAAARAGARAAGAGAVRNRGSAR